MKGVKSLALMAHNMLVVMVRGITTNLSYPLAAYATNSLSGNAFHCTMWECVEYVELSAGLKVLFICCDGAVQNCKFFQMHESGDETVFKTPNPYAPDAADDRDIFFIPDPHHRLKTTRSCFSNSFVCK